MIFSGGIPFVPFGSPRIRYESWNETKTVNSPAEALGANEGLTGGTYLED